MRLPPPLPHDPRQAELEHPKTVKEWHRFYAREIPLRERIADFAAWLSYFAAADLFYVEHGLIERPDDETIRSLEYIAEQIDQDPRLLATLFILAGHGELGIGAQRREVQMRAMHTLERIRKEGANGKS